jgi:hypothetical protein
MTLQQQRTQEALRALPSTGWIDRRDRAVHVLSQMAGLSDEHIATLTAGDVLRSPPAAGTPTCPSPVLDSAIASITSGRLRKGAPSKTSQRAPGPAFRALLGGRGVR